MKGRRKSKAPKKSDSTKYKKHQHRERENRKIKDQQREMREVEFAQRLPGIHVPEVKEQS